MPTPERLDTEHLYGSVVRAFSYFGGTNVELLVGNPNALVPQHRVGDAVAFNESEFFHRKCGFRRHRHSGDSRWIRRRAAIRPI
jgi:hypothetical protein